VDVFTKKLVLEIKLSVVFRFFPLAWYFPTEYYPNCEVVFMGMANIHSIRKSFQSLRLLCTQMPDPGK